MEQFDQLLTCAICLDRYRNPKLLPCQHSFCMECTEGLVDYIRKQVKCPECRAEHRVPFQGVQAFATNVTLQRFLELHIDLTGELPDPLSNQIMERCQVCSEKSYCNICAHCEKKICGDCKEAHIDMLKREISRISNQVKRVMHRLEDAVVLADKNCVQVQNNTSSVFEEIDDIYRRLSKAIRDRFEYLKHEVEKYLTNEMKQLTAFRTNLSIEVENIQSNCDLAEKHMGVDSISNTQWLDNELMDTKDIFLKTMEFIRNFEYEPGDYARRCRFTTTQDPNTLAMTFNNYGELHLPNSSGTQANSMSQGGPQGIMNTHGGNQLSQGSALMRSKSDHRLTMQFRNQPMDDDDCSSSGFGSASTGPVRKFGDPRPPISRYDDDSSGCGGERKSRFRSRFARHLDSFEEPEPPPNRVRFEAPPAKEREKVIDTEDVSRGPISGISRLTDSPRVIQKLSDAERPPKIVPPVVQPVVMQAKTVTTQAPWRTQTRQMSEEDEITKQKKMNKEAEQKLTTSTRRQTSTEPKTPSYTTQQQQQPVVVDDDDAPTPTPPIHSSNNNNSSDTGSNVSTSGRVRKLSADRFPKKRSESEDSGSSESTTSSSGTGAKAKGGLFSTEEVKQRLLKQSDVGGSSSGRKDSTSSVASSTNGITTNAASTTGTARPRFQSRFLNNSSATTKQQTPEAPKEESSSSESSESESEEESEEEPPAPPASTRKPLQSRMEKTDIGPLLARSANARDPVSSSSSTTTNTPSSLYSSSSTTSAAAARAARNQRLEEKSPPSSMSAYSRRTRVTSPPPTTTSSRYGSGTSSYSTPDYSSTTGLSRSRTGTSLYSSPPADEPSSRYSSGLTSKYLNRSRHNFDDDLPSSTSSRYGLSTTTPSSTSSSLPMGTRRSYLTKQPPEKDTNTRSSRLSNIRDRRARIARSKSSHDVLGGIEPDEDEDERSPPKTLYQRRKSTTLGEPEFKPSNDDSSSLSSWARYLKNKYGTKSSERQRSTLGSPTKSPAKSPSQKSPVDELPKFSFTSSQYMSKKRLQFKFGGRGSEPGLFTWPRGISSMDNNIVVADSSNHRIQVFDLHGNFVKEFGQYGNGDGEFDCPASVCQNRIGQFIVSDRYNHRICIFDPSGNHLRSFGSQGTTEGKFNYPWGIGTDSLGFIYVVDKENNRICCFQSDGSFVGTFGTLGSGPGQLDHPHYVAIATATNRVIVSDTNNHRISVFDLNGKPLFSFGEEGSQDGQFKLPRGISVDEAGYIIVGDSGNNRVQIFTPDGIFLRSFGGWGSSDGEFKGMEGICVTSSGLILVCDRENHRIQAF